MVGPLPKPGDWRVDVKFREKGHLLATASGLLLVPPEEALALVTDAAGDSLFRVVKRTPLSAAADGSHRVEVVNKASIRVLAWKIWTSNRVVYQIATRQAVNQLPTDGSNSTSSSCSLAQDARTVTFNLLSSNMLHSLSGTWRLEAVKMHHSAVPVSCLPFHTSSSNNQPVTLPPTNQQLYPNFLNMLAVSRGSSDIGRHLAPGLSVDADGNVTATLVQYEQHAQPKGLPPGVRFVPGMSDAVRMSIGREVRQLLDKIHYVSLLRVHHGLSPQEALLQTAQQLEHAGGSFKKLRKQLATGAPLLGSSSSGSMNNAQLDEAGGSGCSHAYGGQPSAHPTLDVKLLELSAVQ